MENGQSMNASLAQHSFTMELVNGGEQSHNDIMTRRMKNRERQRRYRARKRLEADSMKSSIITQSSSPPLIDEQPLAVISNWSDQQPISIVENWSDRVHSRRDWKKDARSAHVLKDSEVSSSESPSLGLSPASKAELPLGHESHPSASLDLVNNALHETTSGRRDWKAEARKRKT